MQVRLDQALFGYDSGHRLIGSSTSLDSDALWALRGVTDMKISGATRRCLTVLPLPNSRYHAFIRTWPASTAFRPGTVWSHVLLMNLADLGALSDFGFIDSVFRRPDVPEPDSVASGAAPYLRPVVVETPLPASMQTESRLVEVADDLLNWFVSVAYSTGEPSEIVTNDVAVLEPAILSLIGQQWPKLRSAFAARTRHRLSASSIARFQVEVVERPSGKGRVNTPDLEPWSLALARDLRSPDRELRSFLRSFGPFDRSPRRAMSALTRVYMTVVDGSARDTADLIGGLYKKPASMAELKMELFGPAEAHTQPVGQWPLGEALRLKGLFSGPSGSFSYERLGVRHRLAAVAAQSDLEVHGLVSVLRWTDLGEAARAEVVTGLVSGSSAEALVWIAGEYAEVAVDLLSERPDTWSSKEAWDLLGESTLVEMVFASPEVTRGAVLRGLLSASVVEPAVALCEWDPNLWWSVLDPTHAAAIASDSLALETAAAVLARIGARRLNPYDFPVENEAQLDVLLLASAPEDGLWRSVPAQLWVEHGNTLPSSDSRRDRRLASVMLASANRSGNGTIRSRAWASAFGPLYSAFANNGTPEDVGSTLDAVLPGGPSWDWCGRLRQGLAREAFEDNWPDAETKRVAAGAGEFAGDVEDRVARLREQPGGSWMDTILKLFGN